MTNYIKIWNYYEGLASKSFSKEGIIIGIAAAIFMLILLVMVTRLVPKDDVTDEFIFVSTLLIILFPIFVFYSFATGIKSDKDLEKPEYLSEVKKYNINSLKNLGTNINFLKKELKFSTSNNDEEINKILNEFYNPENENKNKNNNNELIKKLKN